MLKNVKLKNVHNCVCYNSCNLRDVIRCCFFVIIGQRRWLCSGAIMNDDINIWCVRKLSGLSHNFRRWCKYVNIVIFWWKTESIIILYWKCTRRWGFVSTTLVFIWLNVMFQAWMTVFWGFHIIETRHNCSIFWFQPFQFAKWKCGNICHHSPAIAIKEMVFTGRWFVV